MLIAALFVNAQSGINPKSVGEWTSKLHPYMDYYSTKKQTNSVNAVMWVDFKGIMASKKSQPQKFTCYMIPFI